jgi:hypothetical protein
LLLCISTERVTLAAMGKNPGPAQRKDAERRDKVSRRNGKDTQPKARLVKTFQDDGDVKNGTAGM